MYNKKLKEYNETDKKEKLWDELREELGLTGRHKINYYLLLLLVLSVSLIMAIAFNKVLKVILLYASCLCIFGHDLFLFI